MIDRFDSPEPGRMLAFARDWNRRRATPVYHFCLLVMPRWGYPAGARFDQQGP